MVIHVLADGTITKDITGRVVKMSDAEELYNLMTKVSKPSHRREVHRNGKKKAG